VAFCGWKKINVLFVRLAFLVQMLNLARFFALCTTALAMASAGF